MSSPKVRGHARGPYAKTEHRRREILETAIDVFATSGYRGGSLREIADRIGISQAGVLHHFANKSELLAEVLALRDELATRDVMDDTAPAGESTLRGYVRMIEHNEGNRGLVELFSILSAEARAADHPAHGYFVERSKRVLGVITEAFAEIDRQGLLREGLDPETAALHLTSLTDGLQLQWLLAPESVNMAEEVRRHLRQTTTLDI